MFEEKLSLPWMENDFVLAKHTHTHTLDNSLKVVMLKIENNSALVDL